MFLLVSVPDESRPGVVNDVGDCNMLSKKLRAVATCDFVHAPCGRVSKRARRFYFGACMQYACCLEGATACTPAWRRGCRRLRWTRLPRSHSRTATCPCSSSRTPPPLLPSRPSLPHRRKCTAAVLNRRRALERCDAGRMRALRCPCTARSIFRASRRVVDARTALCAGTTCRCRTRCTLRRRCTT